MRFTRWHAVLFLAPLGAVVALMYGMMAWTAYVSTNDWVGMAPSWKFVGFKNYATLLGLDRFWFNVRNNLIWLVAFTLPTAAIGMLLAWGLELAGRAEAVLRPIFLYPMALSFVVTGTVWAWMYDPDMGVLNGILRAAGLGRLAGPYIADPAQAVYWMVAAAIWQYSGFAMTLYVAAIRDISREILESARVDGASNTQTFLYIVLPNVRHATMVVVAMLTLFTLKVFDLVWVMTAGGPGYATEVLPYYMFVATFRQQLVGLGAAISVVILVLAMLIVVPYAWWSMRRVAAS